MSKEKESILSRVVEYILVWPIYMMNETVEETHADMEKIHPHDSFLEEDKRAIGVGAGLSGCIMTLVWWAFLIVLLIVLFVLLVIWMLS